MKAFRLTCACGCSSARIFSARASNSCHRGVGFFLVLFIYSLSHIYQGVRCSRYPAPDESRIFHSLKLPCLNSMCSSYQLVDLLRSSALIIRLLPFSLLLL